VAKVDGPQAAAIQGQSNKEQNQFQSLEECVKFLQKKLRWNDVSVVNKQNMKKEVKDDENFPVVHSTVSKIDAEEYYSQNEAEAHRYEGEYTQKGLKDCLVGENIEMNSILGLPGRKCIIVADAGEGKTTTMKRLFIESTLTRISLYISLPQLHGHYSVMSLIIATLQDNYGLTEKEASDVYDTLEEHQFDCRLFLDGLDQTIWDMSNNKTNVSNTTEIAPEQLITNIFHKESSLQNMKVYAAGRPTAVLALEMNVRPDEMLSLNGFSETNSSIIFNYLCDRINFADLPPSIQSYALNPFYLQIISLVFNDGKLIVTNDISMTDILTASMLMLTLTEGLVRNDNIEFNEELKKLSNLAYYLTFKKQTVVFTLNEVSIELDILKAFCICSSSKDIRFRSLKLIETGTLFQFSHQIIQEFLSALHIVCLPCDNDEFSRMIKIFWPITDDNEKFSVVRRNLLGLLFADDYSNLKQLVSVTDEELKVKREMVQLCIQNAWMKSDKLFRYNPLVDDVIVSKLEQFAADNVGDYIRFSSHSLLENKQIATILQLIPSTNKLKLIDCDFRYYEDDEMITTVLEAVTMMATTTDKLRFLNVESDQFIKYKQSIIKIITNNKVKVKLEMDIRGASRDEEVTMCEEMQAICDDKELKLVLI